MVSTSLTRDRIWSEVKYVDPREVLSQFKYMPRENYIRGSVENISAEEIENLIRDLSFQQEDGSYVVRVDDPIKVYKGSDGNLYIQNGNSRVYVINLMLSDPKYSLYQFAPIPYQEYIGEVPLSDEELDILQINSNDSGRKHKTIDIARAIARTKNRTGYTNEQLAQIYRISSAMVGQYLQTLELPEWLIEDYVNKGVMTLLTARKAYAFALENNISLLTVLRELSSTATVKEDGIKISQSHLDKFIKAFKSDSQNPVSEVPGLSQEEDFSDIEESRSLSKKEIPEDFSEESFKEDLESCLIIISDIDLSEESKFFRNQKEREVFLDANSELISQVLKGLANFSHSLISRYNLVRPTLAHTVLSNFLGVILDLFEDESILDECDRETLFQLQRPLNALKKSLGVLHDSLDSLTVPSEDSDPEQSDLEDQ